MVVHPATRTRMRLDPVEPPTASWASAFRSGDSGQIHAPSLRHERSEPHATRLIRPRRTRRNVVGPGISLFTLHRSPDIPREQ